jgi:predicted AAA+ superfamily ATPase
MTKNRYIHDQVIEDLTQKMVFIGGPRQVGKTTFSQSLYKKSDVQYLNWDIDLHRAEILKKEFQNKKLLIFDEIHKNRKWRGYLKGIYDQNKFSQNSQQILVTGSARLDYYRFGGDSLQGRYHYIRLLPFTFNEVKGRNLSDMQTLMSHSGFPEPFLAAREKTTKRWSNEYISRLAREEINTLERVSDLGSIELLAHNLGQYVGGPLSINGLRENFQVAHETLSKWVEILERLYLVFRISPFIGNKIKSVKKEQKLYFYNWTYVDDASYRFENLVALHLLKYCYWENDSNGRSLSLHFSKQKNTPEIDFVICEKNEPLFFIEAKLSDQELNPRFAYFKQKYPAAQFFQVHLLGKKDYQTSSGIRVLPAHLFFQDYIKV